MPKPFAWSYSKLKNFEVCPRRHNEIDNLKSVREELSEELQWGNEVHKHLANRIGSGIPLPRGYEKFEQWAKDISDGHDSTIKVEQKLAITKDFLPCGFFDKGAWYRGIGDVVKVVGPVALAIDWKTGKVKEDLVQLALLAACIFAHYPAVQKVRTEFVWLKHDDTTTRQDFSRADMPAVWKALEPRIAALQRAYETNHYPENPGFLCRNWCPVKRCQHNGA